jgi:hypothetical protein
MEANWRSSDGQCLEFCKVCSWTRPSVTLQLMLPRLFYRIDSWPVHVRLEEIAR